MTPAEFRRTLPQRHRAAFDALIAALTENHVNAVLAVANRVSASPECVIDPAKAKAYATAAYDCAAAIRALGDAP